MRKTKRKSRSRRSISRLSRSKSRNIKIKSISRRSRSKSRRINKKYKGGELAVTPFKMFEFPHGASSESQAALLIGKAKSQEQYDMNKIGGRGGGEPEDTEVQANITGGGETLEVPQFYPPGGIKTAYTATSLSADGNLASLVGEVESTNDHFATSQVAGKKQRFGKRLSQKQRFGKRLSQKYSFYAK